MECGPWVRGDRPEPSGGAWCPVCGNRGLSPCGMGDCGGFEGPFSGFGARFCKLTPPIIPRIQDVVYTYESRK